MEGVSLPWGAVDQDHYSLNYEHQMHRGRLLRLLTRKQVENTMDDLAHIS